MKVYGVSGECVSRTLDNTSHRRIFGKYRDHTLKKSLKINSLRRFLSCLVDAHPPLMGKSHFLQLLVRS